MDFRYYNCMYCYTSQSQGGFLSQDPNGWWKLRKLGQTLMRTCREGRESTRRSGRLGGLCDGEDLSGESSCDCCEAGDFWPPQKNKAYDLHTYSSNSWWFGHYNLFIKVYKMLL